MFISRTKDLFTYFLEHEEADTTPSSRFEEYLIKMLKKETTEDITDQKIVE